MSRFITLSVCLTLFTSTACGPAEEKEAAVVVVTTDDPSGEVDADEGSSDGAVSEQPTEQPVEEPEEEEELAEEEEPEPELERRYASGSWAEDGLDCNVACNEREWACDDVENDAGYATYTYTSQNGSGSVTFRETVDFPACDTPIEASIEEWGDIYRLEQYTCSCLAPPITKIDVDVDALVSCDVACAAIDLDCQPETPWTLGQESGGEAQYRGSDSTRYHPVGCAGAPSTEITRSGRPYTLVGFRCGCQ